MALAPLTAVAEASSKTSAPDEPALASIPAPPPDIAAEEVDAALAAFAVVPLVELPRTPLERFALRYAFGSGAGLRPFVGVVLGVRRESASPTAAASYEALFTLGPQAGFTLSF